MCYTSINNKNHDHHHQKRSNGKKANQNKHRELFFTKSNLKYSFCI